MATPVRGAPDHAPASPESPSSAPAAARGPASPSTSALELYCDALVEVSGREGTPAELLAAAEDALTSALAPDTPGVAFMIGLGLVSPHERVERVEAEAIRRGLTERCALAMADFRARASAEAIRHARPAETVKVAGLTFRVRPDWRPWESGPYASDLGARDVALASTSRTALRPHGDVLLKALPSPAPECSWAIGSFARAHDLPADAEPDTPCSYRADLGAHRRVEMRVLDERVLVVCDADRDTATAVCAELGNAEPDPVAPPVLGERQLAVRGPAGAQRAEFDAVIESQAASIERCRTSTVGRTNLHGTLQLSFVISSDGSIGVATVPASASGPVKAFGHCLVREAKRWRFPPPKGGRALVKAPFGY